MSEVLLQHWHPVVSQVPRHLQHDQAELHPTVRAPFLPVLRVTLLFGKLAQFEILSLYKYAAAIPCHTLSLALYSFDFSLIKYALNYAYVADDYVAVSVWPSRPCYTPWEHVPRRCV